MNFLFLNRTLGPPIDKEHFSVIEKGTTIIGARVIALQQIWKNIEMLNKESKAGEVNAIYIGKSYINHKIKRAFDPCEPSTWEKTGFNNRRGRSQLCRVIAVITEDSIPDIHRQEGCFLDAEEYALILEKRLISHFMTNQRPRVINDTEKEGKKCDNPKEKAGFIVYMSYKIGGKFIIIYIGRGTRGVGATPRFKMHIIVLPPPPRFSPSN